jgi:hypothetical protein
MAEGSTGEENKETEKCLEEDDPGHHHHHHHVHLPHPHLPHPHIKKETSIILKKKEFIFCLIGGLCLVAGLVFFIISMYSIRNCCDCKAGGTRIVSII